MMDGAIITTNQWNELTCFYVSGVSLIYLLGISASKWLNNCGIYCYGYHNKIKGSGLLPMLNHNVDQLKLLCLGNCIFI